MSKVLVVINGAARAGKDTFVDAVRVAAHSVGVAVYNRSSVDIIKEAAELLGWNKESKEDKDRKFLSDLKLLATDFNDHSFEYICREFDLNTDGILFAHVREPAEIEKLEKKYGDNCFSILITAPTRVTKKFDNMADANVNQHSYTAIIENDGDLNNLYDKAKSFVNSLLSVYNIKNTNKKGDI